MSPTYFSIAVSPSSARSRNFFASFRTFGCASARMAARNVSGSLGGALSSPRPCPGPRMAGSSPLPVGLGMWVWCGLCGGAGPAAFAAFAAFAWASCVALSSFR